MLLVTRFAFQIQIARTSMDRDLQSLFLDHEVYRIINEGRILLAKHGKELNFVFPI